MAQLDRVPIEQRAKLRESSSGLLQGREALVRIADTPRTSGPDPLRLELLLANRSQL